MTSLLLNGKEIISQSHGFLYDNHRWIENDRFEQTDAQLDDIGICTLKEEAKKVIIKTFRGSKLCPTAITYTVYPQGIIDMKVDLDPQTMDLRRAGLLCLLDSSLNKVDYYAYGPWENNSDRMGGCMIGRYHTTVDDMRSEYVKPQSMGGREGLRELILTDGNEEGIRIETQGNVSFSALRYTDADLMNAKHIWELQKLQYTLL